MGATAAVTLASTISGISGGVTKRFNLVRSHTSACGIQYKADLTTLRESIIASPTSAKYVYVVPTYSTNLHPFHITADTVSDGFLISSNGFIFLAVSEPMAVGGYTTVSNETVTVSILFL